MLRTLALATATLGLAQLPASAAGETRGYLVRASVPVHCSVRHDAGGTGLAGAAHALGQLREFCNAANGYRLVVNYAPGTLRGARLVVGDEEAVLNGSGQSVISGAVGPRLRTRALSVIPGPTGFDTPTLTFELLPA